MRRKVFQISNTFFSDLFTTESEHRYKILSGLPKDSRIVDVRYDGFDNCTKFLVESEEFDVIKEGCQIEVVNITATNL